MLLLLLLFKKNVFGCVFLIILPSFLLFCVFGVFSRFGLLLWVGSVAWSFTSLSMVIFINHLPGPKDCFRWGASASLSGDQSPHISLLSTKR